jgi:2-polyprenyl-3-methyl-5-hydroxy-6-metoxy-1,4-benzoquinol methylase
MTSSVTTLNQPLAVPGSQLGPLTEINATPHPSCPLCGRAGEFLYTGLVDWLYGVPDNWGTRHCSSCSVAWLDPQPVAMDIPKLYSNYCTHKGNPSMTWVGRLQQQASDNVLARLGYPVQATEGLVPRFLSYLPYAKRNAVLSVLDLPASATGHLLDVGCGNGEFIAHMRSLGWNVSGIDFDSAAVSYARGQGLDVRVATVADLDEAPVYDVIVLTHVIEHVSDPVELLRECAKRLRPGTGRLVIFTPNIRSFGHTLFKHYWRGLEVPRHFVLFSPTALRVCAERAGLSVRSLSTETRLAQMIYNQSAYAKAGESGVAERADFKVRTKISGRLFRMFEGLLLRMKKDAGEEIFCVCTKPARDSGIPGSPPPLRATRKPVNGQGAARES